MEKDLGFHHHRHHHHPHFMLPNPSLLGFPIDTGHLYTRPVRENPHSVVESTLRNAPSFPFPGLNEPNDSRNWHFNMPHFHNAVPPVFNSAPKEKFHAFKFGQHESPTTGPTPPHKRFLVFNQSDDKTTLFYSSGAHTPVQFGPSRAPNFPTTYNSTREELRVSSNPVRPSVNGENIKEDEMHEDTEELDALLCSDYDLSNDDDEETSTGHSPSTTTDNGVLDLVDEIGEEVDSLEGPTKRRKISVGGYNNNVVPSSTPAASSLRISTGSACGDANYKRFKRSRREKVHETLKALRGLIPDVKGKDAVVVIDEAICYLKSLKVEVKALGLDAL